jgi:hypothetical protein
MKCSVVTGTFIGSNGNQEAIVIQGETEIFLGWELREKYPERDFLNMFLLPF